MSERPILLNAYVIVQNGNTTLYPRWPDTKARVEPDSLFICPAGLAVDLIHMKQVFLVADGSLNGELDD